MESAGSANPATKPWYRELTGYHWFVFIVCTLSWMFDCLDQRFFVLARGRALEDLLGGPNDVKWYGSVATALLLLGWATGGIIFGVMGDRLGRAKTLMATITVYSLFTGLSALSVSWWDFCHLSLPDRAGDRRRLRGCRDLDCRGDAVAGTTSLPGSAASFLRRGQHRRFTVGCRVSLEELHRRLGSAFGRPAPRLAHPVPRGHLSGSAGRGGHAVHSRTGELAGDSGRGPPGGRRRACSEAGKLGRALWRSTLAEESDCRRVAGDGRRGRAVGNRLLDPGVDPRRDCRQRPRQHSRRRAFERTRTRSPRTPWRCRTWGLSSA